MFSSCFGQLGRNPPTYVPYVIYFKTNAEIGVVSYKIQRSTNNKTWSQIGLPFLPIQQRDSNWYQVILPNTKTAYYYRQVSVMTGGGVYNSNPFYFKTTAK